MYNEPKDVRGLRVGAAIIDYIIISILMFIITILTIFVPLGNETGPSHVFIYLIYAARILIVFGYFTLLPFLTGGRTLGKLMVGIKVISFNYEKASIWKLLFRNIQFFYYTFIQGIIMLISLEASLVSGLLSGNILNVVNFINLIIVLVSKDARGFHDYIAGTIVVHKTFSIDSINEVNALERKSMEWAVFEDDLKEPVEKQDKIVILEEKDEIDILKNLDQK